MGARFLFDIENLGITLSNSPLIFNEDNSALGKSPILSITVFQANNEFVSSYKSSIYNGIHICRHYVLRGCPVSFHPYNPHNKDKSSYQAHLAFFPSSPPMFQFPNDKSAFPEYSLSFQTNSPLRI